MKQFINITSSNVNSDDSNIIASNEFDIFSACVIAGTTTTTTTTAAAAIIPIILLPSINKILILIAEK